MEITGIICEYNPLHLGHKKQIDQIRAQKGDDHGIVCLMSGNFVQRGTPAVFDKTQRAEAAIRCGADLVLELPVTYALCSAEGFASGGVQILSPFCHQLCFGSETGNAEILLHTARLLLHDEFSAQLKEQLSKGSSFPAARQAALEALGGCGELLSHPNDILAVEYCKAIIAQNSPMKPMPILRRGNYHDTLADTENPSATAVRSLIIAQDSWQAYIPSAARECFYNAPVHELRYGERAILARLWCMTDAEFEMLPYGNEGLWRKFMHAARSCSTIEEILTATKSKRYTRTRLDRMLMCAFLGIFKETISSPVPYVRVLAFNEAGRTILKKAKLSGSFVNIGQSVDHPYQDLENRCSDLYGLFAKDCPTPAGLEAKRRVFHP